MHFQSTEIQFWGLVKITKYTLYLRYRERNKSKQPIPITHCATRLINVEYDLVVFYSQAAILVVLPLD